MKRRFAATLLVPLAFLAILAQPAFAQQAAADRANSADPYAFTQDYEPDPAMWVLADEDTTIYMLGTFHALPPDFRWRSERLDRVVAEVDALYVETSDFDMSLEQVDIAAKFEARLARRLPTSQRLSESGRARWRELVRLSGQDFTAIDEMPLLIALLTMGTSVGEEAWLSSYLYGVETVLEDEFATSGRPIRAIEDSGAVMYSLLRLDGDELMAELDARLGAWNGKQLGSFYDANYVAETGNAFWREEHRWARGIVGDEFDLGFGDGAIGRAFQYNLLERRNALWAEWVEAKLDEPGSILLAVGAGHFEGDESLLVILAKRGLVAERIE